MASRNISDLSPVMQDYYYKMLRAIREDPFLQLMNISVLLTCTYRSGEEQMRLYAQGRTTPGAIITRAKAGQSKHNVVNDKGQPAAEAFDVVPLRDGKPVWGTKGDDLKVWNKVGEHGMGVGLKWYGAPGSVFKEMAHFQNPSV